MPYLPEVDFQLGNIDPLCIAYKLTLTKNGNALLNDVVIPFSGSKLSFPRQGVDNFTFANGDVVSLTIQQGNGYGPNDDPTWGDPQTASITINATIPAGPPAVPNVSSFVRLYQQLSVGGPVSPVTPQSNPNAIYPSIEIDLSNLDTADTLNYNWTVTRGGVQYGTTPTDSGNITIANVITLMAVSDGSFNADGNFPINRLQDGDVLSIQVRTGINLGNGNYLWGAFQVINITATMASAVPPVPAAVTINPWISWFDNNLAMRTKLNLGLTAVDPLCVNFTVKINWQGNILLNNITINNDGSGFISFPDGQLNNDLYPLMGNQSMVDGEQFTITIQQNVQYPFANANGITNGTPSVYPVTLALPAQPTAPTEPFLTVTNTFDANSNFVITMEADSIDADASVATYRAVLGIMRNGQVVQYNGVNLTAANCVSQGNIPAKPFTLTLANFTNLTGFIPNLGDIITYNVTVYKNLNPGNSSSNDELPSDTAVLQYTVINPYAPSPGPLSVTPSVSLYQVNNP